MCNHRNRHSLIVATFRCLWFSSAARRLLRPMTTEGSKIRTGKKAGASAMAFTQRSWPRRIWNDIGVRPLRGEDHPWLCVFRCRAEIPAGASGPNRSTRCRIRSRVSLSRKFSRQPRPYCPAALSTRSTARMPCAPASPSVRDASDIALILIGRCCDDIVPAASVAAQAICRLMHISHPREGA